VNKITNYITLNQSTGRRVGSGQSECRNPHRIRKIDLDHTLKIPHTHPDKNSQIYKVINKLSTSEKSTKENWKLSLLNP
jgi:hypothetical protein